MITNTTMATPTSHHKHSNKETNDLSATMAAAMNTTAVATQGKITTNTQKSKPTFNPWKTVGPGTKNNHQSKPYYYTHTQRLSCAVKLPSPLVTYWQ